jgi:Xaa-Pro aminopeptidase
LQTALTGQVEVKHAPLEGTGPECNAGVVVVTREAAGLWTDFRYYLEAQAVLEGSGIELFKTDQSEVPSYPEWLSTTLSPGARVGVWADSVSVRSFRQVQSELERAGLALEATEDLVGEVWEEVGSRPGLPNGHAFLMADRDAGAGRREKLEYVRTEMRHGGADVLLVPALDEVAWLFNLRGDDIPYNPVVLAYALVTEGGAELFVRDEKLSSTDLKALETDNVTIRPYEEFCESLQALPPEQTVAIDTDAVTLGLRQCIPEQTRVVEMQSPIVLAKARKSTAELDGMRRAMWKDGVAMERFLYWLEQAVPTGLVSEGKAAEVLRDFRAEQPDFVAESFQTISGYGGHGAIVHYRVTEESDTQLGSEGIYLVDSGGQYRHGTTDITRVVPLGAVHGQMKEDYTLVLKGHIALATARFPRGTTGHQIDALARDALWRAGRNYGHGTGHGVGCFLNVHEGPHRISTHPSPAPLEPGMVVSNEPGVYRAEEYGIRIENLVAVHPATETEFDAFLEFETLTLCHIDTRLVEPTLLTEEERRWLNAYNARVNIELADELEEPIRAWLAEQTAAV